MLTNRTNSYKRKLTEIAIVSRLKTLVKHSVPLVYMGRWICLLTWTFGTNSPPQRVSFTVSLLRDPEALPDRSVYYKALTYYKFLDSLKYKKQKLNTLQDRNSYQMGYEHTYICTYITYKHKHNIHIVFITFHLRRALLLLRH